MSIPENRKFLYERLSELYRLRCMSWLLGWDQQVYMPSMAGEERALQQEYLARLIHQKETDPAYLNAVNELYEACDSLSYEDRVNVREVKRLLDIQRKLPEEFVAEFSRTEAASYNVWLKARPADDFSAVQPYLEKMIDLSKQYCDLVGYKEHPYDALLDQYEPGAKTAAVKPLLLGLAEKLRELIPRISQSFCDQTEMDGHYPASAQETLCKRVACDLGFDFERGRLDITAHPFTTSIGSLDTRITTHYFETTFLPGLYALIHEAGHALYDMGLPTQHAGTPMGDSVSFGIHESQSRMWENLVGRSREFCAYLSPILGELFPQQAWNPEDLWRQVNRVCPSMIRIEADEVTYNQHIVIRMLLEEQLILGRLSVADLPNAWNDLYEKYLGVRPTDNKDGVMQDVHWYSGSFGYFPSYALGNLYSAMMFDAAHEAIPGLCEQIRNGQFSGLLNWLRENVHSRGMQFKAGELIRKITGEDLTDQAFVDYLKRKLL